MKNLELQQHLKDRGLNIERYNLFLSEKFCVVFPLWNLSGQMVGFQTYNPFKPKHDNNLNPVELRYHTYVRRDQETNSTNIAVFGVDLLDFKQKFVFVVEGVFDACKLHNLGLNALAVLTSDAERYKSWLWSLGFVVVPVCEDDYNCAGLKLSLLANTNEVIYLSNGCDLGDLEQTVVYELFKKYL